MTSIFKLNVLPTDSELETRPAGARLCRHVLEQLDTHEAVGLDFSSRLATPSFVDELVGGLSDRLGESAFHKRVKFENVPPSLVPLIRHVLAARRLKRLSTVA